jgi:hypothetical protein
MIQPRKNAWGLLRGSRRRGTLGIADLSRLLIDTKPSYERAVEHLASLGHGAVAYLVRPDLSWPHGQHAAAVSDAARRLSLRVGHVPASRRVSKPAGLA